MLQILRELAKSFVFKTLMALLVVSFGIWGIGDIFRGNPAKKTVAQVGKIEIPVFGLEHRFQIELPKAREALGVNLTTPQAMSLGVLERTLHLMIEEYSFDQESNRLGLNVGQDFVLNKIATEPALVDKNTGKFNEALWAQIIRQSGLSEKDFLATDAKNTARQLIVSTLLAEAPTPKIMVDNLYQARGDKRILEIISLTNDSQGASVTTPKDEELEAYFHDHESNYVAPETRDLTLADFSVESLGKDVSLSDQEMRDYYDANVKNFSTPETRDLVQVVVQDESVAKKIYNAAEKDKDLSKSIKAEKLTPIDMKKVDEDQVLPELYTTVFGLEEGQISPPVHSSLGWHVLQLSKINEGGLIPFEKAKEQIVKELREEKVGDLVAQRLNKLDDALAAGRSLEDLAEDFGLHLNRLTDVDAKGMQPDGKKTKELPDVPAILDAGFALNVEETGQIIEDGKGHYFIVRANKITPSQTKEFANVKKDVLSAWRAEQLAVNAEKAAKGIADKIRGGAKATSFASLPGIKVRLSAPISVLGKRDASLPESAYSSIFTMKTGDVMATQTNGMQYVLRLADIVSVDPQKPESSRQQVVEDLRKKLPYSIIEQYSSFLKTFFPVWIDDKLVEQIKERGKDNNG